MSGGRGKSDWPSLREWYYGMPRPIRVMAWWWGAIPLVTFGLWGLLQWAGPNWAWWMWLKHSPWNVVVLFVPVYLAITITALRTRRIRRAFNESGGRLCTHCAQNLGGLADVGKCPECGEPYHVEMDRLTWKRAGVELARGAPEAPTRAGRETER